MQPKVALNKEKMPETWSATSLKEKELFDYQNGLWKGKKEPLKSINVLRNTNFTNEGKLDYSDVANIKVRKSQLKKRKLEYGDIIIERSGGSKNQPVGRVVFFDKKNGLFSFSNFTTRLRIKNKDKCNPKYLLYYLLFLYKSGYTERVQSRTTGIRNLSFNDYKKTKLPLPPHAEQRKIASVLSTVQDAIEQTEAVIQATRELKKSMMKHLFTYGPVPVDQTDRVELKETEIGEVPVDWKIQKLDEISDIASGGTPSRKKKEYWEDGNIPWVKTGEVDYGIVNDTEEKITKEGLNNSSAKLFPKETVLIAMYGQGVTRGRVAKLGLDATSNQACAAFLNLKGITNDYLFYALQYEYERLRSHAHGANQKNLSATLLKQFRIAIPDQKIQTRIVNSLSFVDQKIGQEIDQKLSLVKLFDSLLESLMTAKIRVV